MLQFLLEQTTARDDKDTMDSVAHAAGEGGHIHILEWIYETFNDIDIECAAFGACISGNIQVLNWVKEKTGLESIDSRLDCFSFAACHKQLEALQWLYANG